MRKSEVRGWGFTLGHSKTVATRMPFLASVAPMATRPEPTSAANSVKGAGKFAPLRRQTEPGLSTNSNLLSSYEDTV